MDKAYQRKYLDDISSKYKFTSNDDWISKGKQILMNNGGKTLLFHCYGGSMFHLLSSIYPGA